MTEKAKVLIVDDEPRNQRIAIEILEDLVEYKTASSGEEALELISTFAPDLVMLDIMMPGIDGYEVCQRIKADKEMGLTKVILVSGKAMIEERLKGYECGADEYMTKPFVPEELLAKAKVFLRLTAMEKELLNINRSLDQTVKERTASLLAAEAKLVNSAKMSALGEMAGGVAHEVNTPLGVIGLAVDELYHLSSEEPFDREAFASTAKTIEDTVKRISTIVRGLRNFSREGSADPFEEIPMADVVRDTLSICRERTRNAAIDLRVDAIPESTRITCQPVQLSQVLLNLINNSCDAVENLNERWIQISTTESEKDVVLSITDSGNGIPKEIQERILDPFFTTKGVGKGTGLGLSISKGIIESQRGDLCLDTASPNTKFDIRIPKKPA